MFYGAVVWDPWLIVAQIVCLQCLYYLTLGFFLSFLVGTRVSRLTLVYFFDFATVNISTVTGCCVIASLLPSSFAGAGYMLYLIERAKKRLDFSATLYIIHLFICVIYGGWPSSITWWVVNGTGFAVMTLLGEYLSMRRKFMEIPISRYRSSKKFLHKLNILLKKRTLSMKCHCASFLSLVFIEWQCLWGGNKVHFELLGPKCSMTLFMLIYFAILLVLYSNLVVK